MKTLTLSKINHNKFVEVLLGKTNSFTINVQDKETACEEFMEKMHERITEYFEGIETFTLNIFFYNAPPRVISISSPELLGTENVEHDIRQVMVSAATWPKVSSDTAWIKDDPTCHILRLQPIREMICDYLLLEDLQFLVIQTNPAGQYGVLYGN